MAKHLSLPNVCCYLQSLPVSHFDAVWNAVVAKMTELGVAENLRSIRKLKIDNADSPCGNVAGIVEWIRTLAPPVNLESDQKAAAAWAEETQKLVMLHASIAQRYAIANYTPKADRVED